MVLRRKWQPRGHLHAQPKSRSQLLLAWGIPQRIERLRHPRMAQRTNRLDILRLPSRLRNTPRLGSVPDTGRRIQQSCSLLTLSIRAPSRVCTVIQDEDDGVIRGERIRVVSKAPPTSAGGALVTGAHLSHEERPPGWVGPVPTDQPPMPAQQGVRRHQPHRD